MKRCQVCSDMLPLEQFHRNPTSKDGHRSTCKKCRVSVSRWAALEAKYKLTREGFYALLGAQGGRCAICSKDLPKGTAVVDHCHESGKVRGLLCGQCNTGIGLLGDGRRLDIFDAAKRYLSQ